MRLKFLICVIKATRSNKENNSEYKEFRMCFRLRKGMANVDAFLLRGMRLFLFEIKLLVLKDKLNVHKMLKRERKGKKFTLCNQAG